MGEKVQEFLDRDDKAIGAALKIRMVPFVQKEAKGTRITDIEGKEYLDFSSSWCVANIGYCHPKVVEAVSQQVAKNNFSCYLTILCEPTLELAEKLIQLAPGDFEKKVMFGVSGSDANDCIAKLVPMASGRSRFISYYGSYHGSTGGSLSMSGHSALARFIGGGNVTKIPYPYCYRCPLGEEPEKCGFACLRFLEEQVFTYLSPPEDTAAIVVEAIQCDGGVVVPPEDYFRRIRDICDRHGIYLVMDEVKAGVGRTGAFWAFENFGVVPDAIVFAKPMGSGIPLSGVIARAEIADAGVACHTITLSGNPVATAAGLATVKVIEEEGLVENARTVGAYLKERLTELMGRHEMIGDVRGKGLLIGVEFVRNRETKEPAPKETAKITYRAFEKGLAVYYVGVHSNVLEVTPPLPLTRAEADEGVDKLEAAITDVEQGRVSDEDIARFAGW
jgi:4-aminobutyrate aminotransferase